MSRSQEIWSALRFSLDDDLPNEPFDANEFLNAIRMIDQVSITNLLIRVGFCREKLAVQSWEEAALLSQLLRQLDLDLPLRRQACHLHELGKLIARAQLADVADPLHVRAAVPCTASVPLEDEPNSSLREESNILRYRELGADANVC